jgi:Homeodomain-like domain
MNGVKGVMAAWRRAIELSLGDADTAKLRSIAQSRTEPASRDPSFFAVGRALGLHHQTVQRCVERAVAEGPMAALDDRPRPGREPTITLEAKAWMVPLACRKAKDLGYPHEPWTTRLLARHAREHGPAQGYACLASGELISVSLGMVPGWLRVAEAHSRRRGAGQGGNREPDATTHESRKTRSGNPKNARPLKKMPLIESISRALISCIFTE